MAFDLSKLKGLFVETSNEPSTPGQPSTPVNSAATVVTSGASDTSEPDQKIVDSLLKAIEQNNLPGEDYLEFMDALAAMKNIPLDDTMKVQTVMATLSTKGLTVAKIRESADYYKKVLSNELNQFLTELNNQIEKTVKSKEKIIEAEKLAIQQKSEQIASLTKQINEAQAEIQKTEEALKAANTKIMQTEVNFQKAYHFVVNQIDTNLSKLK
jgi:hypothetical protein